MDPFDWDQVERATNHMAENNIFDELVLYMNLPGHEKVTEPLFKLEPRVYAIARRDRPVVLNNFSLSNFG